MSLVIVLLALGAWKAGEIGGAAHHRIGEWLRRRKRTRLERLQLPRSRVVDVRRRQRIEVIR